MAKAAHEFDCTNCRFYNYPNLRDNMNGNYIIVCGNCGHEHYRFIKMGVVTQDRHDDRYPEMDRILVPRSATQKEKRKLGLIAQLRQKEVAGLHGGGE